MKRRFYSDNGAPCWKCNGTIYQYTTDDTVSLVDVYCWSCGSSDLFRANQEFETAAEVSAAHRKRQPRTLPDVRVRSFRRPPIRRSPLTARPPKYLWWR